jgi:hypothetical protein
VRPRAFWRASGESLSPSGVHRSHVNRISELVARLEASGMERRLLIDAASVAAGVREIGLLLIPTEAVATIFDVCRALDLVGHLGNQLFAGKEYGLFGRALFDIRRTEEDQEMREVWISRRRLNKVPTIKDAYGRLGYPDCCVLRYSQINGFHEYFGEYLQGAAVGKWPINRLAGFFSKYWIALDFFPCCLYCGQAYALAVQTLQVAAKLFGRRYVSTATAALQAPLVLAQHRLMWNPRWSCANNVLNIHFEHSRVLDLTDLHLPAIDHLISFEHFYPVSEVHLVGRKESIQFNVEQGKWI